MVRIFLYLTICVIFLLFSGTVRSETSLEKRIEELEAIVEQQRKEIEALRAQLEKQRLNFILKGLMEEVSQLRHLPFKEEVNFKTLSPENLHLYIQKHIEDQLPGQRLEDYYLVLRVLGFTTEEVNLRKLLTGVYAEQTAGLYDEDSETLYIMDQFDLEQLPAKVILAHELCHALQDQYFDLSSLPIHAKGNDDQALTALAIIEGDAMLLTEDFMSEHLDFKSILQFTGLLSPEQQELARAPDFLKKTLIFPYMQGMEFFQRIMTVRGDRARNEVFKNLPRSTEQIIHPEKYYRDIDEPTTVTLPDLTLLLDKTWQKGLTNVMGEFSIKVLLEQYYSQRKASQIARGWDGDRFCLYRRGKAFLLYWVLVWDSPRDAREFFTALADILIKNHRELKIIGQENDRRLLSSSDKWAKLELKNEQVELIISNDKQTEKVFWRRQD